jgi:hypothetical protein
MNKIPSKPWWASIGFGRRPAEHDTDYADMGTAFGLDASLSADVGYAARSGLPEATIPATDLSVIKPL